MQDENLSKKLNEKAALNLSGFDIEGKSLNKRNCGISRNKSFVALMKNKICARSLATAVCLCLIIILSLIFALLSFILFNTGNAILTPDGGKDSYGTNTKTGAAVTLLDEGGLNIELARTTVTYGELLRLEVKGNTENGEVNYRLVSGEDKVRLDGNAVTGINVGEAVIEVTVGATENFESVVKEFTITVKPRSVVLYWTIPRLTYNGEEQVPEVSVVNRLDGDECTVGVSGNVNAGANLIARAVSLSNENYTLSGGKGLTKRYIIFPLKAILAWGETDLVYTGSEQAPKVEITNLLEGDSCEAIMSGTATDVGSYTAKVSKLSNSNYSLTGVVNLTKDYTIGIADIELSVTPEKIQLGVSTEVELHGNIGNGEAVYTVINNSGSAEFADGMITGTRLGRVFLRVNVSETPNTRAGAVTAEIWVEKLWLDLGIKADSVQYGDTLELQVDGNSGGGQVNYRVESLPDDSGGAEIADNLLTATHIGKVRVVAEVSETEEYESGTAEQIITITPRVAQIVWTFLELEYNGEERLPTATVKLVKDSDVCIAKVEGAQVEPGTYTAEVTALLNADGSESESYILDGANATAEFKIIVKDFDDSIKFDYVTETQVEIYQGLVKHFRTTYGALGWLHGANDTDLDHDTVLGNIPERTSISNLLESMYPDRLLQIKLYDNEGKLAYDCGEYGEGYASYKFVGTGWYLLLGGDEETAEKIRLSVLGDVTGDGMISVEDAELIAEAVRGNAEFVEIEYRLAAYVVNVGDVNAADYATVNAIIMKLVAVEDYLEK